MVLWTDSGIIDRLWRPASHLALGHAVLRAPVLHRSILHTHAVTSDLSLCACPQGLVLLIHYPSLGAGRKRDKREISFNTIFSSLTGPALSKLLFPQNVSNMTELPHIWEVY